MEEIYKEYSKLVYRYLYSLTNDIELAEELMQETFYSAIKGINNFKHECKISVWLCQIAKNKWKNYIASKNKVKLISLDDSMESLSIEDKTIDNIHNKEEIIELYKEIHKLDENTREVFYLRMIGELTFKEIGKITGKSEEWARVTFYRGKIKLREELLNNEKRM